MRLLLIALVSLILLLGSCFDKKSKQVLPEKQMIALLSEVHLLDGYLQTLYIDSAKKIMDTMYYQLLSKYGLDSVSFSNNVEHYYSNPVKTEKMYEKIQENLNTYQLEFTRQDSIQHARERDSLNRVDRYRTLLNFQKDLWSFNPDTAYVFNRDDYIRSLYLPSGLLYLWQNSNVPVPTRTNPPVVTPEPPRKPVGGSPSRDSKLLEHAPVEVPHDVVEEVVETVN